MATHIAKQGDNLWDLAKAYKVSWNELKKLNPQLKDRIPEYWLNPGDVVQLPTCMETGDVKQTGKECPHKIKVLAIEGPSPFRVCAPATFKVSLYQANPTGADKRYRVVWFIRDLITKEDLLTPILKDVILKGETLEIPCVPFDWYDRVLEVGADFDVVPKGAMLVLRTDRCSLYDWIAAIQRAEKAYPSLSGVDMTNAMRLIAGYDDPKFRCLYGGRWWVKVKMPVPVGGGEVDTENGFLQASAKGARYVGPAGPPLVPIGPFTAADRKNLEGWTSHAVKTSGEVGIVEDYDGDTLAAGHVLTGLSGGVYRDKKADLVPEYPVVGEKMDNLYAATISGDLGQVAILELAGEQKSPTYIGPGTDATDAEMIGDIDGWLLGDAEPKGGSGRKLSEILLDYYCPCKSKGVSVRDRYKTFRAKALDPLKKEVFRFATTYAYHVLGKVGGLMADDMVIEAHCQLALKEFDAWLKAR